MKHYLITQFNCDLYDLGWLQRRQPLFERFCLPSVQAQTNKNFEWILVSDARTPPEFKAVLDSYPATVIYYDFSTYDWDAVAPPCNDLEPKMKRAVQLEYIAPVIREYLGTLETEYVITTRLDNDDAISVDFIDRIQQEAAKHFEPIINPKFWLSLPRGYKWCDGFYYPLTSNKNPFCSFVETPQDLITVYSAVHTLIVNRTPYPCHIVRAGDPTWLQVITPEAMLNKLMRERGKQPDTDPEFRARFKARF